MQWKLLHYHVRSLPGFEIANASNMNIGVSYYDQSGSFIGIFYDYRYGWKQYHCQFVILGPEILLIPDYFPPDN